MTRVRKQRNVLLVLLCICLIAQNLFLQTPQRAEAAPNAIVIVSVVNVRVGPGTDYERVKVDGIEAYLVGQQEIEVIGSAGDWYQMKADFRGETITGYVYAPYIAMTNTQPTPSPTATPKPTATPTPVSKYSGAEYELPGMVNVNVLNLRSGPGTEYDKLGTSTNRENVLILNEKRVGNENWYYLVITLDGKEQLGYMLSNYVKLSTEKGFYAKTLEKGCTLRKSASANAKIMTTKDGGKIDLPKNRNLWVYGEVDDNDGNKWFRVRITLDSVKYYGYIRASEVYLYGYSSKKTNTSQANPTPTPATESTKATPIPEPTKALVKDEKYQVPAYVGSTTLNLRTEPNTNCEVLTTMTYNTKVTIIDEVDSGSETWYRIVTTVDKKQVVGYAYGAYLRLTMAMPVEAVISENKTRIRNSANAGAAYVKDDKGKILSLSSGNFVYLIAQTAEDDIQWYQIKTGVEGKNYEGYVPMSSINLVSPTPLATPTPTATPTPKVTATPTPSPKPTATPSPTPTPYMGPGEIQNVTTSLIVKEKPGYSGVSVKDAEGNPVLIRNGKEVEVIGHAKAEGVNWYQISFNYENSKTSGFVNSKYVNTNMDVNEGAGYNDLDFEAKLSVQGFPESYKQQLRILHAKFPNWEFKAFHTGLDWETAITNEDTVGTNLIPNSKGIQWKSLYKGAYNWKTDSFIVHDGSYWVTVSRDGLAYYMDPRNWLTEDYIFQFEMLAYRPEFQNEAGVENILKNTLLSNASYSYVDQFGNYRNMSYGKTFMEAAVYSGVSPYHLASRVKQEVVTGISSLSNSVSGTVSGLEGLYNFYNIGAFHSTVAGGNIANGLKYARDGSTDIALNEKSMIPWTDPYRSIVGGAYYLGNNYIVGRGQNTIYLQKFNMTGISTYRHQYMANVEAPWAEGKKVFAAYGSDAYTQPIVFSIPVYLNMPTYITPAPQTAYNPNNWLKKLTVKDIEDKKLTLTPTFDISYEGEYSLIVDSDCAFISLDGTTVSSKATIAGEGYSPVETGVNRVVLSVTAENGDVREYVINVIRESN